MKIPMRQKLILTAILVFSILSAYYLIKTVEALYSGSVAAHKRYHQTEIFRAEDPAMFYQTLAFLVIGSLAPAWVAYVLIRQRRSKSK